MGTSFTNPLGRHKLPLFQEASTQKSKRDSDVTTKIWQKDKTNGQQIFRVSQGLEQVQRQLNRLRLRKTGEEESGAGWEFASPKEYDYTTAYVADQIVIVGQDNEAVTDGVDTGTNPATEGGLLKGVDGWDEGLVKATAGMYVCIKSPKVLSGTQPDVEDPPLPANYDIHLPTFPTPNYNSTGFNPDSSLIYWMPIPFPSQAVLRVKVTGAGVSNYYPCKQWDGTSLGRYELKVWPIWGNSGPSGSVIWPPIVVDDPEADPDPIEGTKLFVVLASGRTGLFDIDPDPDEELRWLALMDDRNWMTPIGLCNDKWAYFHCSEMFDVE